MKKFQNIIQKIKKYGFERFFLKSIYWISKLIYYNIFKISPFNFCYSMYGVLIKKNFSDNTFKYYLIAQNGFFFSSFLKKQKNTSVFLDIGANQGVFSLIALKNSNFTKIFSFEPQEKIYSILCENIKRNLGEKICTPLKLGISNTSGPAKLKEWIPKKLTDMQDSGKSRIESEVDLMIYPGEIIETIHGVKLSTLLSLDPKEKIGIKIDTEGHEIKVLKGLINTNFWGNVMWIFVEFNIRVNHKDLLFLLTEEGFSPTKKIPTSNPNHFDLLLTRNAHFRK